MDDEKRQGVCVCVCVCVCVHAGAYMCAFARVGSRVRNVKERNDPWANGFVTGKGVYLH